ncbi:hypothetical protein PYK79_10950 [Streptomyces sp. ID05-04B]|uniref:hypothetical protein n=1 Tax=Streptomyces sp. ID05-04B TaxID=3028661 RepID=UPI0029C407AB|nr:hypothetical protein [Streptomyces sp. ID05-04B]MDX5563771.1 hypothetical protein [Streptomyces sp. ID05-04B]
MPAISVGSVEVDVIPNTQGIYNRLRDALVPAATRAGQDAGNAAGRAFGPAMTSSISNTIGQRIGQRLGQQIASRITASIRSSLTSGITQGGQQARPAAARQGEQAGGAFARSLRAKLTEAFRSMPKLDVKLGDTGVDADLARLRAKLESLADKTIGIDIDAATARAQAADIEERLRRIGAAHPNVAVRADTARAIAQLQALQAQIDEVSADPLRIRMETDGQLGTRLRAAVEQAEASLPNVNIGADTTPAQVEIARLRAQLTALRDARIGVDIDAATALARITEIQTRLARLSSQDADVAVRVDAGAASAQLAAFQAAVNRLDGQTANVDVDTRSAAANLNLLATAALTFGPAILPVLPVVAAGLGAIAAAAVAAAAGIGGIALVAVPAFKQIGGVLQAQKAAQDAATNATYKGGQAAAQGAAKALQLAGAQQSLATAERNGARQIAQAQQQVVQAKRAAADAVVQAGLRNAQAARQVQDAERSLGDAQIAAKKAQLDLTAARRQAVQELQDLNNQLTDSVLSQRDAEIQLKEATAQRNAVLNSANASELDRQKALLAYDQAVQRLKEQTTETGRLKAETAAANKAGVEGSATVVSAQDRLAQSQRAVADQARAVRDAQAEAARTQVETARQVAEAQRRVGEATANVAVAQQNAADSVASAQRQIQSASLSAAGGVDQAAIAQAKYQAELAKLTPAARATMTAYLGLRDAFSSWSKALQPAVMPIFTRALNGMKASLPGLTPLAKGAADAIGGLMDRASAQFKTPFWKTFKDDLDTSVKPAITGLGVAFGNVFKGMAGILGAFLPHMDGISASMQRVTGRFAAWGASLRGSPAFERFLAYSARMAPVIWQGLKDITSAVVSLATALQPLTAFAYKVIGALAQGIGWISDNAPFVVQGIYAIVLAVQAWKIAMAVWTGVVWLASAAMTAFTVISKAGPWGWIALGIAALVVGIIYAYKRFEWFRDGVNAVLDWVKQYWPYLVGALGGPMGVAVVYIVRHWDSIKAAFSSSWEWIKRWVVNPIGTFFTKIIPGWATTLQEKTVAAFNAAKDGIKNAWDQIKAITKAPVQYVVDVVYNTGIRGVWNKIAGAFGATKLPEFKFANGGVMPGYTPGKDVHKFVSPTGGQLELSGGESFFRPEFTRGVGSGFVGAMNSIAKSKGAQGVKAALAPVLGGSAPVPTDRSLRYANGGVYPVQRFADGGIFGWIKSAGSAVLGAGSAAWNKIKESASWLKDTLAASARAGVTRVVDPLLKSFPGMDTGFGQLIRHIPDKIIDSLFGYTKEADEKGGGGLGGPRIQAALKWARTQNGLPYQWAGNGNPSWDCSGFMSAIESVIRGQKPHRRWATMAFSGTTAPPGWVYHGNSPFRVGITNAGVGHTAGTIGGVNVESRGGDGVVVGSRARGYDNSLFGSWYGFKPGSYDSGGYLQPGMNLAFNGTGRPEPVFTTAQANALTSMARSGPSAPSKFEGNLYLDGGEFLGRVRGEAQQVMQQGHQALISVFDAS